MQNAIEFRNVKKAYGDQVIMENFNLAVEKGEFVTIIGSSGCGKTTALKMVNGLIHRSQSLKMRMTVFPLWMQRFWKTVSLQ